MSTPKKNKPVKATVSRKGHQLPTRVSDALWSLLATEAKRVERRSVSQTVRILIEEALKARGRQVPREEDE